MRRALSLAVALVALAPAAAEAQVIEQVVATVDGEPIWASEVVERAAQLGLGVERYGEVLDALIEEHLVSRVARRLAVRASDDEIDRAIEQVRLQNGLEPEAFAEAIAAQGLTMEGYRALMAKQIVRLRVVRILARDEEGASAEEVERRVLGAIRQSAFITRRL